MDFRYAICNETFEGWDHARVCRFVAGLGYAGLEMAPFTLAPLITDVSRSPPARPPPPGRGLRPDDPRPALAAGEDGRAATDQPGRGDAAQHGRLPGRAGAVLPRPGRRHPGVRLAGAAPRPGRHRRREQAADYAVDTFRRAAPGLAEAGVRLCLEPLSPPEADFINTAAEAVAMLDRLDHPNFALHLDVKAMATDGPAPELIRRYAAGRDISTPTTRTGAAPASAAPISCRSSGPCATATTGAGCRSRCSITRPTRKRSRARACATCGSVRHGFSRRPRAARCSTTHRPAGGAGGGSR